ncbi:hypothetical protein FVEN_g2934 [Fusarium venenatum]|uniref:Uncharacterized protein n=1 Tax=Fusarium venenatum TaxID=56646 RepID=A0A2L2SY48_9HYPO|nr:uncharacterized protein FVRRES_06314 [Fusarium venenatum]KAG8359517.1 hypothetical protein FVEN_g2934 [Fusarium venenatum]KAH6993323.1 hypothetical protein EDB82DRAFT_545532 [Fusarium venenatum]CEI61878.1 unnamed protein product [Fusarium venenatum]
MSDPSPCAVLTLPVEIPHITSTSEVLDLDYFGPVDDSISIEGSKFVARLTDGVENEVARIIKEFIVTTQNDCVGNAKEKRACWFTIRSTKPTDEFNIPRWHQDGPMYPYDKGREEVVRSKYALTLLGPPTLMLVPDEDAFATERQGIAQHFWWQEKDTHRPSAEEWDEADLKLRKWLENEFKETPRVQIEHGQIVRFSWGRDNSPLHSEPDIICDRIFISVLYGSESELRRMCDWREGKYGKFEADI